MYHVVVLQPNGNPISAIYSMNSKVEQHVLAVDYACCNEHSSKTLTMAGWLE